MIHLILISENERECNILTIAFEQRGIKVLRSESKYQNYVFVMQYMPDLIVIELPHYCIEQLDFAKRIRSFKKTRSIPILGYGDAVSQSIVNGMNKNGISIYLPRPLKFSILMEHVEKHLKMVKKSIEKQPVVSAKDQDIALLLNSEAMPAQKKEVMVRHVANLVAFPFTVAKVLNITQSEETGAQHLAKAVTADPYMAAFILKVSNTVFFASANRSISSIKDAIVRIGFNETKRIVLGMAVMKLFEIGNRNCGFDRIDFWYHSLATAIIAERVAKNFSDVNLEEAFLAGLLHDFGMILFDDCFPSIFETILDTTVKDAGLFYDTTIATIGVSHIDMITELFPKWKLPAAITEGIRNQYAVLDQDGDISTPGMKLSACIAIGNAIAKLLHIGKECDGYVAPLSDKLFMQARLPAGITPAIIDFINQQVTFYATFLNLEKREYTSESFDGIDLSAIIIGICNPDKNIVVPPALFLSQRKVRCESLLPDRDSEIYNEKFHVIICWTVTTINEGLVERLKKIRKNPQGSEQPSPYAPLIVLAPEVELKKIPDEEGRCVCLPNRLDYRILEAKLFGILSPVVTATADKKSDE